MDQFLDTAEEHNASTFRIDIMKLNFYFYWPRYLVKMLVSTEELT
jgi:hypothetical protein